jgi:hypothetical protein
MATQSYRQRLKAQRPKPGPSAKLCKELHRQAELRYEIRKLAMDGAVVGGAGQGQGRRADCSQCSRITNTRGWPRARR